MDYKRREEIFSKEALHITDVMELYDKSYSTACGMIQNWKSQLRVQRGWLRMNMEGMIHMLDYFDIMGIDPNDPGYRYFPNKRKSAATPQSVSDSARKSVCIYKGKKQS